MQPTDFCIYVDHKGKAHKAQADAVHPQMGESPNPEPLVDLSYINPTTGLREKVLGLKHISHPDKQETNSALPTIHLHAWKRTDEEHTAPAEDHPIFDHPHEQNKIDPFGKVVVKHRPKHEAMIAAHREANGITDEVAQPEPDASDASVVAHVARVAAPVVPDVRNEDRTPEHPGTVAFPFTCQSCEASVLRLASHQGGSQFEPKQKDGQWVKHVCVERSKPVSPAAVAEQAPVPEPLPPANPLEQVEGEVTSAELGKHVPIISVVLSSTTGAYEGVQVTLPGGRIHVVKANGFDQDGEDAIRFIQVNGFTAWVNDDSVAEFVRVRNEKAKAAMEPPNEPEQVKTNQNEAAQTEVDVIHELQNAPPAPDAQPQPQGQNEGEQAEG